MVTVAMPLNITEPQVEVLAETRQHRLVGQAAEAIAVQKMQQRLAAGRRAPAAQGETFGALVRPGNQLHRFAVLYALRKRRFYKQQRVKRYH
ncbi:hypothetical protein D3C76_1500460 [compost metagenome]